MHKPTFPVRRVVADERTWIALLAVTAVVATAICVGRVCNNFLIFRAAFDHLVVGTDMYVLHPGEHADLYKYSPTFALLFAPFRFLGYGPALLIWNLLNVLLIYAALRLVLGTGQRLRAVQVLAIGMVTTLDGTQSNGLVAATMLFAFAALERNRLWAASGSIVLGALIKIFPLATLTFALPRRDRWKFAATFIGAGAVLVAAPLVVTDVATLVAQYRSWYAMGAADALDRGASVMRLLHDVAGYDGPNWPVQILGAALLMLPLARGKWSDPTHRQLMLASLLVFSVIFNHKAEQPSYIIAVVGVAIWCAIGPTSGWRLTMAAGFLAATAGLLAAVAFPAFPGGLRYPLALSAFTCTAIWVSMQLELLDLVPRDQAVLPEPAIAAD